MAFRRLPFVSYFQEGRAVRTQKFSNADVTVILNAVTSEYQIILLSWQRNKFYSF